jgi:uncharacterized membrane protein YphA (DoxX/SURF4 family)
MKKILLTLSYIPFIYLVYVFAGHGVEGVEDPSNYYEIISKIGVTGALATVIVVFVSVLDTFVGVLLVAGKKIIPALPTFAIYLWCGIWPWLPRLVEWHGGMEPEISSAVYAGIAALAAYLIRVYYHHDRS